ncbi:MAG: hypothetical protein DJ555_03170 [Desulfurococcaceae archaeon]|nr:MAG: hypothetical protein DJ555_03170 [Desulfurococcaceae archaeon]
MLPESWDDLGWITNGMGCLKTTLVVSRNNISISLTLQLGYTAIMVTTLPLIPVSLKTDVWLII